MEQLRRDGVAIILTTHLMDEVERLADQVVIVDQGRLVAEGSPSSLTSGGAEGVVQFDAPSGLDVGSLAAALPGPVRATEVSAGRYLVDGAVTPDLLAALTAWCAEHDVLARSLQVGRRTLEDVFLELTGKELR
jgi:ABC-2 type transport system ATP-binding protein